MIPPTKEQAAVLTAAVRWWLTQRPMAWGETEHLVQPHVNCSGCEVDLAHAVADLVRADPFGYGAGKRAKRKTK